MGFRVVGRKLVDPLYSARKPAHAEQASSVLSAIPKRPARREQKAKASYPGKIAIRHAGEAAQALGVDIGGIEISPDGTIRVLDRGALPDKPHDEFAQWEQAGKLA